MIVRAGAIVATVGAAVLLAGCSSARQTKASCETGPRFVVAVDNIALFEGHVYRQAGHVFAGGSCITLAAYWRQGHPRVSPYCVWIAPARLNPWYTKTDATNDVAPKGVVTRIGDGC